jgi:transcription elongation factor Elf1
MLEMNNRRHNLTEPPGVPCPECGAVIHFTIEKLLSARPVYCSDCGLKLTLEVQKSQESLAALKRLNDAFEKIEQSNHPSGSGRLLK